ncbi:hypothetical protein Tco_0883425 [Tanacetum coccineum]
MKVSAARVIEALTTASKRGETVIQALYLIGSILSRNGHEGANETTQLMAKFSLEITAKEAQWRHHNHGWPAGNRVILKVAIGIRDGIQ